MRKGYGIGKHMRERILKRIICCVCIVVMVSGSLPFERQAAGRLEAQAAETYEYTVGNSTYNYVIEDNGEITITRHRGTDTEISIPEEIDGKKVMAISDLRNAKLQVIEIPKSIKYISCDDSWNEINPSLPHFSAFYRCTNLTYIKVSEENEYYKDIDGVLFNKSGTKLISYPPARKQKEYEVPEGVEIVLMGICLELNTIKIPESVENFNYESTVPLFYDGTGNNEHYSSIANIEVSKENRKYKDIDGVLFNKNGTKLLCYPPERSQKEYSVPEGVESIDILGTSELEVIKISSSVDSIGNLQSGSHNNSSITDIKVSEENKSYKDIDGVLFNKDGTRLISYPLARKQKEYVIPETVTEINESAFTNCRNLVTIRFPKTLNSIVEIAGGGVYDYGHHIAFNCSSLTDIQVAEGNEKFYDIDGVLFEKTNNYAYGDVCLLVKYPGGKTAKEYDIPKGVTDIAGSAFDNNYLEEVRIPESVHRVGVSFYNCSNLKIMEIPKYAKFMPYNDIHDSLSPCLEYIKVSAEHAEYRDIDGVVFNKDGTELIAYPSGKKGDYTIPKGVVSIHYNAFNGCKSLESIKIPEGVTRIDSGFGSGCISVEIPKSVTYISEKSVGYYSGSVKIHNLTIYGYKNTAAETYADENGFRFVDLEETGTKSSDLDINIEYKKDLIEDDDNVTLVTDELDKTDEAFQKISIADLIFGSMVKPGDVKFIAYTIELQDKNGKVIQPKGTITVRIPVPSGYAGSRCKIYYVDENGVFTDMKAIFKNAFMEFTTNHFSTYIITETELKTGVAPPSEDFGSTDDSGSDTENPADKPNNEDKTEANPSCILNGTGNNADNVTGGNNLNSGINNGADSSTVFTENPGSTKNPASTNTSDNNVSAATGDTSAEKTVLLSIISIISIGVLAVLTCKKKKI